jgi:chromate reductase, NAD(P)H dehydrogenase (quinone)
MALILGLSGSLRRGSFNTMLLRAASEMAPAGTTIEIGSIEGIPLYNGDVEEQGIPAAVQQLKDRVAAADGLLLVTPEYNGSIPGVMKNAIDWLSRPAADIRRVFRDRPVGVIGASPGPGGTGLAQIAWLAVLRTLGTAPWFGARVTAARVRDAFDADGRLIDETIRGQLQTFVKGFAAYVDAHTR